MSLRSYVFTALTTDIQLNALGVAADKTFTTHDTDTPQVRPLMILRWQNVQPGMYGDDSPPLVNRRTLTVWVHDKPGDYDLIDQILSRVRAILTGISAEQVGTSAWVSQVNWQADSEDLRDDAVGTITRNSEYLITGSGV